MASAAAAAEGRREGVTSAGSDDLPRVPGREQGDGDEL